VRKFRKSAFQNLRLISCNCAVDLVRSRMAQLLLDDALWARLEPLIPKPRRRARRRGGRPRVSERAALTGILFVLRSGLLWPMLPREMGCASGSTCWRRLVKRERAGVWRRLHETLLAELRRRGRLDQR
jgi:transposase